MKCNQIGRKFKLYISNRIYEFIPGSCSDLRQMLLWYVFLFHSKDISVGYFTKSVV